MSAGSEQSLSFQSLDAANVEVVRSWPAYAGSCNALDYALRAGGWLDSMPESPSTKRYAVTRGGELVGFSLLTDITEDAAEIYLAVKPGLSGQGIGRYLMVRTLKCAFDEMKLAHVYLKVRVWHQRAIGLYEDIGFIATGGTQEEIAGEMVDFTVMDLLSADFARYRAAHPA